MRFVITFNCLFLINIVNWTLIQYKHSISTSYQYRKVHCGDKTVVRSSYLHSGNSYTGKMSCLHWIRAMVSLFSSHVVCRHMWIHTRLQNPLNYSHATSSSLNGYIRPLCKQCPRVLGTWLGLKHGSCGWIQCHNHEFAWTFFEEIKTMAVLYAL